MYIWLIIWKAQYEMRRQEFFEKLILAHNDWGQNFVKRLVGSSRWETGFPVSDWSLDRNLYNYCARI